MFLAEISNDVISIKTSFSQIVWWYFHSRLLILSFTIIRLYLVLLQSLYSLWSILRMKASSICRLVVESLQTGRWRDEVGSRIENTTCPRQLSHCTWLLIIFSCYLLQSHLLVEGALLCFSKFAQNPLFTILSSSFLGLLVRIKLIVSLHFCMKKGKCLPRRLRSYWCFLCILEWIKTLSNSHKYNNI